MICPCCIAPLISQLFSTTSNGYMSFYMPLMSSLVQLFSIYFMKKQKMHNKFIIGVILLIAHNVAFASYYYLLEYKHIAPINNIPKIIAISMWTVIIIVSILMVTNKKQCGKNGCDNKH